MSKFVEVMVDGLTVVGQVRMAGDVVQVPEKFPLTGKRKQVARWGHPKYREITREDFLTQGGQELENYPAPTKTPEVPEAAENGSGDSSVEPPDPFESFEGLSVEDTLKAAAALDEGELDAFIVHEKAGKNRSEVLGPLGVE